MVDRIKRTAVKGRQSVPIVGSITVSGDQ